MSATSSSAGPPGRAMLAKAVAEAVAAVPGVAAMSAGGGGVEIGTQYAGGTVLGVALQPETVVVHVVVEHFPLSEVVEPARSAAEAALRQLGDPRAVEMVVEDIVIEELRSGLDG